MENDSPIIEPITETIWRVVVIGKSGTGKSATCNTLLGGNKFESKFSNTPTTKSCKSATSFIDDIQRDIMIIDTPGIFDVEEDTDAINAEMKRCKELSRPGFSAILMVISLSERFTSEDQEIFKQYKHHFGVGIMRYVIVVFTNADRLEGSIDAYVDNAPSALKRFLNSCGDRYFAIENRKSDNECNEKQRKGLLRTIMKLVQQNDGCMYTDYKVGVSRENTEDAIRNKIRKEMQPEFERQETMVKKKIENNEGKKESKLRPKNPSIIDKFKGIFPSTRIFSGSIGRNSLRQDPPSETKNKKIEQISTETKITQNQDLAGQEIPDVASNEMVIDSTQDTTLEEKINTDIPETETKGRIHENMDIDLKQNSSTREEEIDKDDGHAKSVDGKMDEEENNTQDDTGERNKQAIAEPEAEDMTKEKMDIDLKQTSKTKEEEIKKDNGHAVSVDGKIDEKGKKTQDDKGQRHKQEIAQPDTTNMTQEEMNIDLEQNASTEEEGNQKDNPETATVEQKSCDPCSSNNDPKKGLIWCQECDECYCVDCSKTHRYSKLTRSHKLIQLKENK